MTALRQRLYRVTVGTLRVGAPARVAFTIERTARATPGKATVSLWNLSLDHQRQIEQSHDAQVIIEAGHESTGRGLERLFQGALVRAGGGRGGHAPPVRTQASSVDVVTHVEARDGGREHQQRRTSRSWEPGVSIETVMRGLVEDLGVGAGNLNDAVRFAQAAGTVSFDEGFVVSGQAAHELTRLLAGVGLRWSIQHGSFQAMRGGAPLEQQVVRLAPSTGLIGHPEPATHGRVKATSILTSDIWPGRALVLDHPRTSGRYTVRELKSSADSHGNDWQSDLELAV